MKKFTFKNVLEGFRSTVTQPTSKPEHATIVETLKPEFFQVSKTVRHGFPHSPTTIAFDPVQKLLAIGTKNGSIRLIGRPGVAISLKHEGDDPVLQILFLINEGAFISLTADDSIHLWNFRQKQPEIVHTLKFQKERITHINLSFKSKWLYLGTDRGNVYFINIEVFQLSGYVINWNKAIELSRKTHPGCVVHISECPADSSKLVIGFESGQIVIWDLRTRTCDIRYQSSEQLRSISWHHEGKQFMCSHVDGSLTTWAVKGVNSKPTNIIFPHSKSKDELKPECCRPIHRVEWKSCRNSDPFVIFSGGLPNDASGRTPCITVMHGKNTTVLEMEHAVVDFTTLCETPWQSDFAEPYALAVLLQNDLVLVDLSTPGYPCFENLYAMDLHESPVTSCFYVADCPADLIPALYPIGARSQRKAGFSEKEWPISGGEWGSTSCSYSELVITGHADGSLKFWDASSVTFQFLYKLKTSKIFEKSKTKGEQGGGGGGSGSEDPLAVMQIALCPESRLLCIAGGSSHVIFCKFSKQETSGEITCLEIPIAYDAYENRSLSPELEPPKQTSVEYIVPIRVKAGIQKKSAGYQPELVCIIPRVNGDSPGPITFVTINSSYGLIAYGNDYGIAIVDYIQKVCLLNMGTPELYGGVDPYQRAPKSPKKLDIKEKEEELGTSPSSDQLNGGLFCISPTTAGAKPSVTKRPTDKSETMRRSRSQEKFESSTFSRSRSSSICSLENVSTEAVHCLAFADTYSKNSENQLCPTLWVGTSLGSVIQITIALPTDSEARNDQAVTVMPSGTIFRLKGSVLAMSFLDCNGALIPYTFESWKDANKESRRFLERTPTKGVGNNRTSPTNISSEQQQTYSDRQFMVIASDKVARVVALPSNNCVYKQIITEVSFVVKAEIIQIKDAVCLVCYIATGHISIFSLPSLRQLVYVDFLPLADLSFQTRKTGIVDPMLAIWGQQIFVNEDTSSIARTFCFTNHGHGLYLCSKSEIQKFTISAEFCKDLQELLGTLFLPCASPEAPKPSFNLFKELFGGGTAQLDREELFGETAGKASRTLAKHIPGPSAQVEQLGVRASTVASEVNKTRMQLLERGEKLGQLEDRTGKMMMEAEGFSTNAHSLMLKYKDKKWYQM